MGAAAPTLADRDAMLTRLIDSAGIPISTQDVADACPLRTYQRPCLDHTDHSLRWWERSVVSRTCDGTTVTVSHHAYGNAVSRHLRHWAAEGLIERVVVPGDRRAFWLYAGDPVAALGALEEAWEVGR
jgi:hypothetical protein